MTSIDLSKRLREVHGLHEFAELFGFSWEDESDWDWHDVACAMADAIDATVGANDASTLQAKVKAQSDYINKLSGEYKALDEQMERSCAEYRSEIHKLRAELDAATVGAEPDEATMLKLHDRMNAALLDYESAMGIKGGNGANTVPFVIEMHSLLEEAAKAGARIEEATE